MSDPTLPSAPAFPPPAPAPAPAPRQTSAMAIVSLVLGLLGWTLLPLVGSLGAIICGHMARAEIRRNPATLEGDGLAVAGLALGWTLVAICIAAVLAMLLFFGGLAVLLGALGMSGEF